MQRVWGGCTELEYNFEIFFDLIGRKNCPQILQLLILVNLKINVFSKVFRKMRIGDNYYHKLNYFLYFSIFFHNFFLLMIKS